MTDTFVSLGTWNWLIFAFILMALETIAPGVFLFWLGLAALLVGLISFAVHLSWQTQLVMFAIFAAAAVPVWAAARPAEAPMQAQAPSSTSAPRRCSAVSSRWRSRSSTATAPCASATRSGASQVPDTPAGTRVKVVQVDGVNLTVAVA
ncbi:NfeD family protein [Bradyrhizobium diazoefficiens]